MKKVHEFVSDLNSHTIYGEPETSQRFEEETGHKASWRTFSLEEIAAMGGHISNPKPSERFSNGWMIANWCEETFAGTKTNYRFHGRGSQYRAALESLEKAVV